MNEQHKTDSRGVVSDVSADQIQRATAMKPRHTHTVALISISADTHAEIAAKLHDVGYTHAFLDDGVIDMTGIGVVAGADAAQEDREASSGFESLPKYSVNSAEEERIANIFTYHAPKPDQLPRYEALRTAGLNLARLIGVTTPPSRERSLALTKLEETVMHANSAIARNE